MIPFVYFIALVWAVIGMLVFPDAKALDKYTTLGQVVMVILHGPFVWCCGIVAGIITAYSASGIPEFFSKLFIRESFRKPSKKVKAEKVVKLEKVIPELDVRKSYNAPNNKMAWASEHIEKLLNGEMIKIRPVGKSMTGKISSGQLCTIVPITDLEKIDKSLKVGDIVLCEVKSRHYVHLIKAISKSGFTIGNNKGDINGVIPLDKIFGVVIKVED